MDLDLLRPDERREAVSAWLDGELAPDEARAVEAWVAAHPEEAEAVRAWRRTWEVLGAYEDEPVPAGFADRVLRAAAGEPEEETAADRRSLLAIVWRPLAAAAVLVVGLVAGARLLGPRPGAPEGREAPEAPSATTALLEEVPPDVLEQADVLLALSEDEFSALLEVDPDEVADPRGG